MQKLLLLLAGASLLVCPTGAIAAQYGDNDVRPGAFAGARFQIAFGGQRASKPRASLAVAPTLNRTSGGMVVKTAIGEGIALNLGSKPTLTLAGAPADQALGLASSNEVDAKRSQNLSTVGWIAVGTGVVAVAAGLPYLQLDYIMEHNED